MGTQKLGPLQAQWRDALLSGRYEQGTERLVSAEGACGKYCCLGVAVAEFDGGPIDPWVANLSPYPDVISSLALRSKNGAIFPPCDGSDSLADMNDRGATFEEIANFMTEHPEAIFEREA